MNSINQQKAFRTGSAAILMVCLTQLLAISSPALAQSTSTTTTVKTKTTPLAKSTTTTTTVLKKRSPHLKKRRGKTARRTTHVSTTTGLRTNSTLSGGVAKKHKHRIVRGFSSDKTSSAQQKRSDKLNAFLKSQPTMKKAPYTNPPGLDVPSSPAL